MAKKKVAKSNTSKPKTRKRVKPVPSKEPPDLAKAKEGWFGR